MGYRNKYIVALIKITKYPESVRNGELYCHNLRYFRDVEKKEIGDSNEATAISKMLFDRFWIRFEDLNLLSQPIFCMYSVEVSRQHCPRIIRLTDERLMSFGNTGVIIKDLKKFLKRVKDAYPEFIFDPVRYIDLANPNGIDKFSIFNPIAVKDRYFSYQRESRLHSPAWALADQTGDIITGVHYIKAPAKFFSIGNLADLVDIHPIEDLYKGVNVSLKVDWNFCHKNMLMPEMPRGKHPSK